MDIPRLPVKKYNEIRHEVRSGDILLCSGNSLISSLIQQATNSMWSHVAFILRLDEIGRIMVLESVESIGVRAVPLSNYVRDYDGSGRGYPGKLMIARHNQVQAKNIIKLSRFAVDLLGHRYHSEEIARIITRLTLPLGQTQVDHHHENRDFICSEYVHICFESIGINVEYNDLGFIAPADFARCKDVQGLSFIATEGAMVEEAVSRKQIASNIHT